MQKIITKHLKNITLSFKNIKRDLTGKEKILTLSFKNITLSFGIIISGFLFSNSVFADSVDYTVNVSPSLNITLSGDIDTTSNNIVLNLNPNNKTSDSKDLVVKVGTNNITGYKLIMSTVDDSTDLVRDNTDNLGNATIPTLTTGTSFVSLTDFPTNKWGYKKDSGNFIPFTSNIELLENNTATNEDSTTLTFASKIDYHQMAGRYAATLAFTATATPVLPYLQDYDKTTCATEASSNSITLYDRRDLNDYQVRFINGNCWMVQNLRLGYNADNPTSYTISSLDSTNTNISYSAGDLTVYNIITTGASDTAGNNYCYGTYDNNTQTGTGGAHTNYCIYSASNSYTNGPTVWYNYSLATVGQIKGTSSTDTVIQDICPKGWRMPTNAENNSVSGNSYVSILNPTLGGDIYYGQIQGQSSVGWWWSSTLYQGPLAYAMVFRSSSNSLETSWNASRIDGMFVRCILK